MQGKLLEHLIARQQPGGGPQPLPPPDHPLPLSDTAQPLPPALPPEGH